MDKGPAIGMNIKKHSCKKQIHHETIYVIFISLFISYQSGQSLLNVLKEARPSITAFTLLQLGRRTCISLIDAFPPFEFVKFSIII